MGKGKLEIRNNSVLFHNRLKKNVYYLLQFRINNIFHELAKLKIHIQISKCQTRNMAKISSKYLKISKVLDWGFFLILFGLAIFFVWSVLQQYSNKDTSFTQYQQPIKKRPTITICIPFFGYPNNLDRLDLKFKWIYEKQFTFTYENTVLKLGTQ